MSITSIGSSFSTLPQIPPVPQAAPGAKIEPAAAQARQPMRDQGSDGGEKRFPAQLASDRAKEAAARPSAGILLDAQEVARALPSASPKDAVRAYSAM